MKKEILKSIVTKLGTLGKAKIAVIAVTSCVAVGGISAGTYYIVQSSKEANKTSAEVSTETMSEDELAKYEEFKERFKVAQDAYPELILDDSQNAILVDLYDTVGSMIEDDLKTGKANEETEQQLITLEDNIKSFRESGIEELEKTETAYREMYESHTVPPTEEAELPNYIELDEETITTLESLQEEYDSLKSAEKYKSAYNKIKEMQDVILNFVSDYMANQEVVEGTTELQTDDKPVNTTTKNNNSSDNGSETATVSKPEPSGANLDELYPELWPGQTMQSRIAHARYNLYTMTTYESGGVTYYGYYNVPQVSGPDVESHAACINKIWEQYPLEQYPDIEIVYIDLGDTETYVQFVGVATN